MYCCLLLTASGESDGRPRRELVGTTENVNTGLISVNVPAGDCRAVTLNTVSDGLITKVVVKLWYEIPIRIVAWLEVMHVETGTVVTLCSGGHC